MPPDISPFLSFFAAHFAGRQSATAAVAMKTSAVRMPRHREKNSQRGCIFICDEAEVSDAKNPIERRPQDTLGRFGSPLRRGISLAHELRP